MNKKRKKKEAERRPKKKKNFAAQILINDNKKKRPLSFCHFSIFINKKKTLNVFSSAKVPTLFFIKKKKN